MQIAAAGGEESRAVTSLQMTKKSGSRIARIPRSLRGPGAPGVWVTQRLVAAGAEGFQGYFFSDVFRNRLPAFQVFNR